MHKPGLLPDIAHWLTVTVPELKMPPPSRCGGGPPTLRAGAESGRFGTCAADHSGWKRLVPGKDRRLGRHSGTAVVPSPLGFGFARYSFIRKTRRRRVKNFNAPGPPRIKVVCPGHAEEPLPRARGVVPLLDGGEGSEARRRDTTLRGPSLG
jgi:hypothetical protein